jgi:cell division protein FtsL
MKCQILQTQCPARRFTLLNYILIACCILLTASLITYQWWDRGNIVEEQRKTNAQVNELQKAEDARNVINQKQNWVEKSYGVPIKK